MSGITLMVSLFFVVKSSSENMFGSRWSVITGI